MADDQETVLTSRRAWLRDADGWTAGRLRLTDRCLRFTSDVVLVEVDLRSITAVRVTRRPRHVLVIDTGGSTLRLRCFAVPAIAALLLPRSG